MQGRHITPQALRALGAQERITMVTSFRPKSPHLPDDLNLNTTRGISDLSELYYQFGSYRLEVLEARIKYQLQKVKDDYVLGKKTNTAALKRFLDEQERFLRHAKNEMPLDEKILFGKQPELDISDDLTSEPKPQTAFEKARLS